MSDDHEVRYSDGAQAEKVVKMNYPNNSHNAKSKAESPSKNPEKKVEKIISGGAKERKKSLGRKIADTFTGDNMHSVGQYILQEIVIPQIKTIISDAVSQGTDRTLFGDSARTRRPAYSGTNRSYTSYNRYSGNAGSAGRASEPDERRPVAKPSSSRDLNDIVLDTRADADQVLDTLTDLIGTYKVASVSDYYDLVGITGDFTAEKWGWFDLREARIQRVRDGFVINFPRTEPID